MSLPNRNFDLSAGADQVKEAILKGHLVPFYKKAGMFALGGVGRHIKWTEQTDGSLKGKLGYFRSKNHCVFRFRLICIPRNSGSEVILRVEHGPFSLFLKILTFILSLCICGVGVVFFFIGNSFSKKGQSLILQFIQSNLVDWDLGLRGRAPEEVTIGTDQPEFQPESPPSSEYQNEHAESSLSVASLIEPTTPHSTFEVTGKTGNIERENGRPAAMGTEKNDIAEMTVKVGADSEDRQPVADRRSAGTRRVVLGSVLAIITVAIVIPAVLHVFKGKSPESQSSLSTSRDTSEYHPASGISSKAEPPFSSSPDGKYTVEIHEDSQRGRLIIVNERGERLMEEPAMGYLLHAHWSPGGRFLALNERRANSGDYLWIIDLQGQRVLKRPDDSIWQEMESKSLAILKDTADKKWGDGVQDDRDWGTASGWENENTLLATVTVRFLGSSIAVGEDSRLEVVSKLSVKPGEVSIHEETRPASRRVGDGLLIPACRIEFIEDTGTLISTFEWYARFGAERVTTKIDDLDLNSTKIGPKNDRGPFEGGVTVEIPLKPNISAKKERWAPGPLDFSWSMPPDKAIESRDWLSTTALGPDEAAALVSALRVLKPPSSIQPDQVQPSGQSSSSLSAYEGKVGRLDARFELDWHSDGTVTGRYWYPGRNPELKYELKGQNPKEGELHLNEFTNGKHSATLLMRKDSAADLVTWKGRMSNTDGRQFDAIMTRVKQTSVPQSNSGNLPPSPGLMEFPSTLGFIWSGNALAPKSLDDLSPWELKLLRNAIFARHGRTFETGKLLGFFHRYPGYKEDTDYSDNRITPTDRANAEEIKAAELRARRPTADTARNALRSFLDALAVGDVEFIASLIHPSNSVERVMFTLDDPPKVAHQKRLSGSSKELRELWLDDGANGEGYCFMMSALWDFTLSPQYAGDGMFRNKGSSMEIGFTEISGKWWLTRVADAAP